MVRYVALGDSYAIGTGVEPDQAWPRQLATRLTDLDLDLVANLAVNGSTADDVATEQMPDLESLAPELASLLVGVNDVVQGVPEERYGARVSEILDGLLQLLPASRLFAVATPDYTASRQGGAYGVPEQQRAAVLRNNEILRGACEYRGIAYVADTFEISGEFSGSAGMLARGWPAPERRAVRALGRRDRTGGSGDAGATIRRPMTETSEQPIRARMAPSPTGPLHIGTARTSLYNFLFARHNGGSYVLRIEDTDLVRSTADDERDIIDNLHWLGITWDEGPQVAGGEDIGPFGPYRQSNRSELYAAEAARLLESGHAYHCWCTPQELEAVRREQEAEKEAPRYNGRCLRLTDADRAQFAAEGRQPAVRFKVPPEVVRFDDLVRGEVEFDNSLLGDFIIVRADGSPLYHFVVVIDDEKMEISHVIRGEDHISNTPKHIALIRALGYREPRFGHIPLILNADRSKMSKRKSQTR